MFLTNYYYVMYLQLLTYKKTKVVFYAILAVLTYRKKPPMYCTVALKTLIQKILPSVLFL